MGQNCNVLILYFLMLYILICQNVYKCSSSSFINPYLLLFVRSNGVNALLSSAQDATQTLEAKLCGGGQEGGGCPGCQCQRLQVARPASGGGDSEEQQCLSGMLSRSWERAERIQRPALGRSSRFCVYFFSSSFLAWQQSSCSIRLPASGTAKKTFNRTLGLT